jgi:hypothetical protein
MTVQFPGKFSCRIAERQILRKFTNKNTTNTDELKELKEMERLQTLAKFDLSLK